ncbi:MAG: radical SAM protein [Deltaproteobacteria bacterium]|nr:radical SAM protein [Deltaproteobacteria bacterium]
MSIRANKSLIVPIFIPNLGCPNRCIFCNQETITTQTNSVIGGAHVRQILDSALASKTFSPPRSNNSPREVAFYGGTFTRLPAFKMIELLEAVEPYLKQGHFQSIRISTRPDAIHQKGLELIKDLGVSTIELGVQSLDRDVLRLSERGYTVEDVMESIRLVKKYGFRLGIQLMPGLPGDSKERFMAGIQKVIDIKPHMIRLYPTIVIKGTELEKLYHSGKYKPLSLGEAVSVCMDSCRRLEDRDIPVIRMGLMASPSLTQKGEIVAGPWHEAFGFLVRSGIHQNRIGSYLPRFKETQRFGIRSPNREIPLIRGYKNQGLDLIERKTGAKVVYVKPDDSIPSGRLAIDRLKT